MHRGLLLLVFAMPLSGGTAWDFEICAAREETWYGEREGKRQHWVETRTSCRSGSAFAEADRVRVEWRCCGITPDVPGQESFLAVSLDRGRTFAHLDAESRRWWRERVDECPSRRAFFGLLSASVEPVSVSFSPNAGEGGAPYVAHVRLETRGRFVFAYRNELDWRVRVVPAQASVPAAEAVVRLFDDDALFRCTNLIRASPARVEAVSTDTTRSERPTSSRIVIDISNARPWTPANTSFVVPADWKRVDPPER